ncbi:XRE family transcriptional regulator (plasmid) [Clostridium carboxidivorans P7]|uniref:Transcriptional regulator, XRE family n=1 Tax=Clostridium carboxidivorans P7 TaxID=536227 RepID=C6PZY5_9CLOT|nr:helix-turn-helix transcriptional regulator [Clostridium carboxidivorans]ADO12137.1 XRE family transcriptional regulator [Clostridium carboxidivorans P7]AKN34271.1 XRE family transcriptional regulator [Clostridium carboxidivorans P7]EET85195.1 transcriptional regulator, XRE family [Clostridium carboxidivorans P7]EFG87529.1 helix-turn-helix domain-containing protein [Clostridium carboxidivorans P7]
MDKFGKRLKELREEFDLTQSDLASNLSTKEHVVSTQNISYWENGREPSYDILVKIADRFNVTTDYLTGRCPFRDYSVQMELKNTEIFGSMDAHEKKNAYALIENIFTNLSNFHNQSTQHYKSFYNALNLVNEFYFELLESTLSQDRITEEDYMKELLDNGIIILDDNSQYKLIDPVKLLKNSNTPLNSTSKLRDEIISNLNNSYQDILSFVHIKRLPEYYTIIEKLTSTWKPEKDQ